MRSNLITICDACSADIEGEPILLGLDQLYEVCSQVCAKVLPQIIADNLRYDEAIEQLHFIDEPRALNYNFEDYILGSLS